MPQDTANPETQREAAELRRRVVEDGFARKWSFTPLVGKRPTLKKWQHAARETCEQALQWAEAGNIGIRTGSNSGGLIIVDVDVGADQSLDLPMTVTVETGSGGRHYYYLSTDEVKNSVGKIMPHVDVRSSGGQAVAVGSIHPETHRVYRFAAGRAPWEIEVAALPPWVLSKSSTVAGYRDVELTNKRGASVDSPLGTRTQSTLVEDQLTEVRLAKVGTRNDTLNRVAFTLGQLVTATGLDRSEVERALIDASALPFDEATRTIRSGIDAGMRNPRPGARARAPGWAQAPNGLAATRPARNQPMIELTDVGNASRLAQRHGRTLRYCHARGVWLIWNGHRWQVDCSEQVVRLCKETALAIYLECELAPGIAEQKQVAMWARTSQSRDRIVAMEALARPELSIELKRLDRDEWALNCPNGTVDLRSGNLRPHDPGDMITKVTPVHYVPTAVCPSWDRFLEEVLPEAEVRAFLQKWLGYSLTGDIREQLLPILWGKGNNGKNVLLNLVRRVAGTDYVTDAAPDLMVASPHREHPTELADLCGRRLVIASETERGVEMKLQLVKRLTGDPVIKGRFMRQDFFEFPRTHKTLLVTNSLPIVREDSEAVWRRLRIVPFQVVIPEARRDTGLEAKIAQEAEGVLAWLVRGALLWHRDGLGYPEAIRRTTESYREQADPVRSFVAERCLRDTSAWVSSAALFAAFQETQSGLTMKAFGCQLRNLGLEPAKNAKDERGWRGLRLRTT